MKKTKLVNRSNRKKTFNLEANGGQTKREIG